MLFDGLVHFGSFIVAQIQHVQHRSHRHKQKSADGLAFFGCERQFAQRLFGFQMRFALFQNVFFLFEQLVGLLLEVLIDAFEALGNLFVIGKDQLEIEIGGIAQRIDGALGVRHAGIVKDADHMGDGVHVAKRSEAFAHALFLHAAQVNVLHRGVGDFLRVVELGQLQEARLRHFGHADVRGLAAFALDVGFRQDSEQSGLSYLW